LLDLLLIVMLHLIVNEFVLLHLKFLYEHLQLYDNVNILFDIDYMDVSKYKFKVYSLERIFITIS
jgi:hypothetical protein